MPASRNAGPRPATDLRALRDTLGLSRDQLARALGVTAPTVGRWEAAGSGPARADAKRRLAVIAEIADLAHEVYGNAVPAFVATPRRSLEMRAPREAMAQGDVEAVHEVLVDALEGHWT